MCVLTREDLCIRAHSVEDHIDDDGPAGIFRPVFCRPVKGERVVKDPVSGWYLGQERTVKGFALAVVEHLAGGVHLPGQACDGQESPAVTAGNVLQAAVIGVCIIERDPAGEVGHGLGPGPVGIVLVPGNKTSMLRWFNKELVVEEPNGPAQQLVGCHAKSGSPGQVMEGWFELPGTECVEEHLALIFSLVEVEFIKEGVVRMAGVNDLVELIAELFKLEGIKNRDPGQEPILFVALYLLPAQGIALPFTWSLRGIEEFADWFVLSGKVHGRYFFPKAS